MQESNMDRTISEYIHLSKYSRWLDNEKRRETWEETTSRFINFWEEKIPTMPKFVGGRNDEELSDILRHLPEIHEYIHSTKAVPSMRSMMTAGKALQRDEISGYNCTATAVNHVAVFSEAFYILMNGCFDKDTLIKTEDGVKKICDITKDDMVLTYDTDNKQYMYKNPEMVFQTPQSKDKPKLRLEFEDGHIVECTENHKFLTTNRGWVEAGQLTEEDNIENFGEINLKV